MRFVFFVWLLFIFKAVFYASFIPLWEGFDEFSHFGVVQHLALTGQLPKMGSSTDSYEVSESLNYVPVPWTIRQSRPGWISQDSFWRLPVTDRDRRSHLLFAMPEGWAKVETPGEPGSLYEAQQPPLAYLALYAPYRLLGAASLPVRVWILRIFCCIISSLTIPIGFLAARRVFVNEWHGVGAVLIVSAMPEFLITTTRISNEALAVVFGTMTLYFVTRLLTVTFKDRWRPPAPSVRRSVAAC